MDVFGFSTYLYISNLLSKLKKNHLIVLLLLSWSGIISGQSYTFRHYQVENGLSYNSVMCGLQDKRGFLWFGTKDGLNKFDGYAFKIFRNDHDDPGSLGSNFIHSINEDNLGIIWVGTLKGLYTYEAQNEKFTLIKNTQNSDVREVKTDTSGNVWFISGLTFSHFNRKTGKLKLYDNAGINATSLSISGTTIWIATTDGFLCEFDSVKDSFKRYSVFDKSGHAISRWIEKIHDTGHHTILVGTSNQGVKLFNTVTKNYEDVLTNNPDKTDIYARDFLYLHDNKYLIATESGLFELDLQTRKYINLRKQYNNPYSISDNATYCLIKDKEGGIWVGTYFGGVNYSPNQKVFFDKYFYQGNQKSIAGNAIREIKHDDFGNLWIGTEDAGLNKYDLRTGNFTNFSPTAPGKVISYTNIHGLAVKGQELWVGTFEHGLDVLNIKTGKLIRHYAAGSGANDLRSNFIETLFKTRNNDIIVGASAGLYKYNPAKDNFNAIDKIPQIYHNNAILEDKDGTIWVGTLRNGLYFYNPKTDESGGYTYDDDDRQSLSNNSVNGLFTDSRNHLWVTTENGLCKFERHTKKFIRYSTKNGFPSNVFYKILEDRTGNLWISTSKGLVCFNPKSGKINTYTKANGLLSDQFNYNSAYQDQDGKMFFGSVNGLISFNPEKFSHNTFVPPVYITGFQVFNEELPINKDDSPLKQSISFTNKIQLGYSQSTFSIDFAALGFTAPEMTEYSYIMEGLDKKWTYLKTNRKIYFTELSPGKYTFKVKSSNGSGIWNNQITQLEIIVSPPFWASVWAYILYSFIISGSIIYLIRNYHKNINRKNQRKIELLEIEKEKEIYQAKIEFFTYVTHEIRTPLTLIKAPLEDLMKKSEEIPALQDNLVTMEKNTNRLLELTNQLLDFRKTETKGFSLNFVNTNISKLLEDTYLRFKSTAELKQRQMQIHLPENPLYAYADPEALNKIISNLLDNAVKYADQKIEVELNVSESNTESFTIVVKNDGNPIPLNMQEKIFEPFFRIDDNNEGGTGIGLPLAKSLALLHEGTLSFHADHSNFNVFILTLPVHHEKEFKVYQEPLVQVPIKSPEELPDPAIERPTILLVEDNLEIIEFIAEKLHKDYTVLKSSNGLEALKILGTNSIHLIVSDVMMPVMNGFELCKTVKDNLDFTHIPIILLTARNTLQAKIEGLESGADAYIEKPFSPEHLLIQISNLLANRDKIKHYFASSPLVHIKSMAYNKADEAFLEKLNEAIYKNLDNKSLDVELLADQMNMSRPTFYRKIKAISNLSPNELINITRLKRAAELLVESDHKIQQIALMTGFSSQAQFGRNFVKQFGITPSEYAKTKSTARTQNL